MLSGRFSGNPGKGRTGGMVPSNERFKIRDKFYMSSIENLNDKQQEAVLHTDGPLLILAGAGSGKTRVITNRIAHIIENLGVDPYQMLAITFTNKAAAEMRERIDAQLGTDARGAWICTFHSACVRILRAHSNLIGFDTNFTIYDRDDQTTVVKRICKNLNIDTKQYKEKTFINRISAAKDELIDPDRFEKELSDDRFGRMAAKVYRAYEAELKKNNAFDFDDLIVKTVRLFRENPSVLERYQDRFRYISVDEYQDTNTAQFVFVSMLAAKYKNICVVGDDDQSIYKFRGANIENILSFEKSFPGAKVIRLEQNYRSTQNILDAANAIIGNNKKRKVKKLWTDNETGSRIKLYYTDNPYVEADSVIREIRRFLKEGYTYADCACLYRTNAQSRALEEAFIRAGIPYKVIGGVNFYQRKEIKDVLAYLKTIDNGNDDVAVRRIINVPKRGIGAAAVNMVQALADDRVIGFYSALETGIVEGEFGRAGEKLRAFADMIDDLKIKKDMLPLTDLADEVLDRSGYMKELELENSDESVSRIQNIQELLNKLAQYEQESDEPTLSGFLEEVALIADIDSLEEGRDYVSLITIHSAKGLEFSNVFLCGMEDGLFPMNAAICSPDETDLEEERRLAYVGVTRARKNLILTAAKTRMVRGETTFSSLSRFVKEIPGELIEEDRENERETVPRDQNTVIKDSSRDLFKAKPYGASAPGRQFAVKNAAGPGYEVGDTVSHMKFGEGTVLAINEGGRDYEVTVDFDDFGVKKMFAEFAKLKKI